MSRIAYFIGGPEHGKILSLETTPVTYTVLGLPTPVWTDSVEPYGEVATTRFDYGKTECRELERRGAVLYLLQES